MIVIMAKSPYLRKSNSRNLCTPLYCIQPIGRDSLHVSDQCAIVWGGLVTPGGIYIRFSLVVCLVSQHPEVSFSLEWMEFMPWVFDPVCGAGFSCIRVFCILGTLVSLVSFPSLVFTHYIVLRSRYKCLDCTVL